MSKITSTEYKTQDKSRSQLKSDLDTTNTEGVRMVVVYGGVLGRGGKILVRIFGLRWVGGIKFSLGPFGMIIGVEKNL